MGLKSIGNGPEMENDEVNAKQKHQRWTSYQQTTNKSSDLSKGVQYQIFEAYISNSWQEWSYSVLLSFTSLCLQQYSPNLSFLSSQRICKSALIQNNTSSLPNRAIQSNQNHSVISLSNSKSTQDANLSSNADDRLEAKFSTTCEQPMKEGSSTNLSPSDARKEKKMRLNFRVKWCNQYRNIVPNLINQLMSFLLKRAKSQKIIRKLFTKLTLCSKCTIGGFYLYMRGMRDSFSHYLNEAVLTRFFELQEPNLQVYGYQEQSSYMKVCRLAVQHFLASDSLLLNLICSKMRSQKRQLHLVGRRALLDKFYELARQNK